MISQLSLAEENERLTFRIDGKFGVITVTHFEVIVT